MKQLRVPPALLMSALGLAVLAGCSADPSEFRDQAEKNIVGVLGSGARADCQEPAGTAVGVTFACTGTDASGRRTTYTAEITKRDEVTVRPDR